MDGCVQIHRPGPPKAEFLATMRPCACPNLCGTPRLQEEEPLKASKDQACELSFENLETTCGRVAPKVMSCRQKMWAKMVDVACEFGHSPGLTLLNVVHGKLREFVRMLMKN